MEDKMESAQLSEIRGTIDDCQNVVEPNSFTKVQST